jgi:predicted alpha/beta superfamily hydrolase
LKSSPVRRSDVAHAVLAALALAASPLQAAEPSVFAGAGAGQPIHFGRTFEVPSAVLRQTRRVNVLLPQGYDDPKRAHLRYPVLYLLDGGTGWQDFFHIAALVQQGGVWGANAPVIVVGVESKDRRAEFTSPSSDPAEQKDFPTHGKAAQFRRFLTEELQPAVRDAFRTDGVDGLIGESLAGLFVVETALVQPDAFSRYIAVSPSLWWDRQALAARAAALLKTPAQPGRRLWLSMADEGGAMQAALDRLVAALRAAPAGRLQWSYAPFPQEKHATIYHPAATRAVREVFPPAEPAK